MEELGRNFLRAVLQDSAIKNKLRVVAINIGPASGETTAHMFKYDSTMGTYKGSCDHGQGNFLVVDDLRIAIISELFPENIDWKMLNIDWVVECSRGSSLNGPTRKKIVRLARIKYLFLLLQKMMTSR